jgi:hypothetical protein
VAYWMALKILRAIAASCRVTAATSTTAFNCLWSLAPIVSCTSTFGERAEKKYRKVAILVEKDGAVYCLRFLVGWLS